MIYVYANGVVSDTPRSDMDDYFTVDEDLTKRELFNKLVGHFGYTHQCINVMNDVCELCHPQPYE